MGASIRRPFVLMLGGTSLTAGRLCNPPLPWTYFLLEDMRGSPECVGPVRIINTGKGSQTSDFGATQAALMAPLKPTHVLMEDFAINDCAIGPSSIPTATANFNSMVASYRTANPDVIIVHQTMSPASATDANRTNLADYYDNGLANAALNDVLSIDNYYGTDLVPGGWPKPLDPTITVGAVPFAITPTSGYVAMAADTVWNSADKAATVTLTNGALTATAASAAIAAARATHTMSGKVHFEVTIGTASGNFPLIGVGNATASLGGFTGDSNSLGLTMAGSVFTSNISVGTVGFVPTSGSTIAVEIDVPGLLAYFSNGTVRSSGFNLSAIGGALYPMMGVNASGTGLTAHFSLDGDGLHPLWSPTAFQAYSYPNILAWARQAMADYWQPGGNEIITVDEMQRITTISGRQIVTQAT